MTNEIKKYCEGLDCAICDEKEPCIYKIANELQEKLKRKEQEYEELRQYHNKCCEENAKKEAEWLEKYNQISIGFYNGDYCNTKHCSLLKAKEQECEELKKIIDEAKNSKLDLKSFLVSEAIQNEYEEQLNQLKEQLEAYKMETEEGKEIYAELKAELEQYKNVINKLAGKTVAITTYDTPTEFCDHKDLTIQQLKAENEELKNFHINLVGVKGCEIKELVKYKQTLTEIKEIAEKIADECEIEPYGACALKAKEQILQKISEVENEHIN